MKRRWTRILLLTLGSVVGLILVALLTATLTLRNSLPRLDGEVALSGLSAPVTISRDDHGVPDIAASDRIDAARALGYLHGQDRFFQMDTIRRLAAGELAALVGPAALAADRDNRRHRFAARAEQAASVLPAADKVLLAAYAAGVNAGLDDLGARPFEYWLLRQRPEPWRPSDSLLAMYAMSLDLGLSGVRDEAGCGVARDVLPEAALRLLMPWSNRWDVPLQDDPTPGVQIPDSTELDVREWTYSGMTWQVYRDSLFSEAAIDTAAAPAAPDERKGSNGWAVAGSRTPHGGGMMASDMHLALGLPNTWYRARIRWTDAKGKHDLVGVTLPGTPVLVSGSNGRVAWGFTNSYIDFVDLVVIEPDSTDADRYLTPDGPRAYRHLDEVITVAGAAPETLRIDETIWGPVWTEDVAGRPLALRWSMHDLPCANLNLRKLETAATVDEALAVAPTCGIPPQNLMVADGDGNIGWTICGLVPRRVGWDGRLPVSWADGSCRWDGYLTPDEQPRVFNPPEGLVWSANNRVAGGADLAKLGTVGFAPGTRARQILADLRALPVATEEDMLAIQLDVRAGFLEDWRALWLAVLDRHPPAAGSPRARFREFLTTEWDPRAVPTSASYYLAMDVRGRCERYVLGNLWQVCASRSDAFRENALPFQSAVAWELITARPPHLLPVHCRDWDDVVLQSIDDIMRRAGDQPERYAEQRAFGEVVVEHPFASLVPQAARWLSAPPRVLPGSGRVPRAQGRSFGASDRMVVSPGREDEGLFHMPGGQSGHPLSPYFLKGHTDWEEGNPTPLLPGPAVHVLVLEARG